MEELRVYRGHALSAEILNDAVKAGEVIGLRVGHGTEAQILVLPLEPWLAIVEAHHGKPEEPIVLKTGTGPDGLCKENLERVIEDDNATPFLVLGSPFGEIGKYGPLRSVAVLVKASEFWLERMKEEEGDE